MFPASEFNKSLHSYLWRIVSNRESRTTRGQDQIDAPGNGHVGPQHDLALDLDHVIGHDLGVNKLPPAASLLLYHIL